jgi:hypothetical protein
MTSCKHILLLLPEYLDKTLSESEQLATKAHLDLCAHCSGELAYLSNLMTLLNAEKAITSPAPSYWSTVLPRIRSRIDRSAIFSNVQWIEHVASPVGAALLIVMIALQLIPRGNEVMQDNFQNELSTIETEQLETLNDEHENVSLIQLQSYSDDEADAKSSLEMILDEEPTDVVYAYMGSDEILNNFNEDELASLVNIMNTNEPAN